MSFEVRLSGHPEAVAAHVVPQLVADLVASGVTAADPTLWGAAAEAEARVRLGWVDAVMASRPLVAEIAALREQFLARGVTRFVLAGMGGSSLAPEVIAASFDVPLTVLDSTAPGEVLAALDGDGSDGGLTRTALIVSSKSGSTLETDSARRAFEAQFRDLGIDPAERIVVVTDPDSPLAQWATSVGCRVFTADPNVGGRYSALTAFGLVPAGLAGADVGALLDEAEATMLTVAVDAPDNPALVLAAALAGTPADGAPRKDKIALVSDGTAPAGLADWIEQLMAESTGKEGTGLLPVVLLPVSPEIDDATDDLQIVRFVNDVDDTGMFDDTWSEILVSGSLGGHFLTWEYAIAIAGRLLGIDPFDQPDVEAAKAATRRLLEARPIEAPPAFVEEGIEVRVSEPDLAAAGTVRGVLDELWTRLGPDGYVSLQAYVDRDALPQLAGLRELVAADAARPTTFGWGPRFLHSTGQYHKGGPATGVFLQIRERTEVDLEIPGRTFTFGELIAAQAAGDAAVLADHGRPVVTLTLTDPQADILGLFEAAD
ncbi:glucose-6-phosphate isomerase [Microbacterium gorillae]|uniref:glucose-6-phosphate isomerase n=1 Tax=Microbacterium gorillae TaxID=1231063 RepID=UPI00058DB430|nr:glucose-6-phosphate isomerase [Microbacterium gorillae]